MEYEDVKKYAEIVYNLRCLKEEEINKRVDSRVNELANNILKIFDLSTVNEKFIKSIYIFSEHYDELEFNVNYKDRTVSSYYDNIGYSWRTCIEKELVNYLELILRVNYDEKVLLKLKEIFDSFDNYYAKVERENNKTKGVEIFIGAEQE